MIPDAAVEAAAAAEWAAMGLTRPTPRTAETVRNRMRLVLEAAAPHLVPKGDQK